MDQFRAARLPCANQSGRRVPDCHFQMTVPVKDCAAYRHVGTTGGHFFGEQAVHRAICRKPSPAVRTRLICAPIYPCGDITVEKQCVGNGALDRGALAYVPHKKIRHGCQEGRLSIRDSGKAACLTITDFSTKPAFIKNHSGAALTCQKIFLPARLAQ